MRLAARGFPYCVKQEELVLFGGFFNFSALFAKLEIGSSALFFSLLKVLNPLKTGSWGTRCEALPKDGPLASSRPSRGKSTGLISQSGSFCLSSGSHELFCGKQISERESCPPQ